MSITNIIKDPQTNWKYILIVLVLGILVGGGILGYQEYTARQETPTPTSPIDETANWKTYRNTKYGFSLRLPADWSVDESLYPTIGITTPERLGISLTVVENPEKRSFKDFITKDAPPEFNKETFVFTTKTLNGLSVFQYTIPGDIYRGASVTAITKDNSRFVFIGIPASITVSGIDEREFMRTFEFILSTFQFLDPVRE